MKSKISRNRVLNLFIISAVISGFFSFDQYASAGSFYDVPSSSSYSTAISYLNDVGIISGYPDGSFQPFKTINRAEFLKLLLESSGVTSDISASSGFPDIDENAWYAKYVRKAVSEGWVEGYPDGTFKPDQGINKAEGLKIIAKVQGWQTGAVLTAPFNDTPADAWYTTYVAYAKDRNFLEERTRFYVPEAILMRAQVSEVLFRTYVTAQNHAEIYDTSFAANLSVTTSVNSSNMPEPVIPADPQMDFTPYSFETTGRSFFEGVTLNEDFPNHFYLNEVYYFEGKIINSGYKKVFIFVAPANESDTSKFTNYVGEVNSQSFKIPVIFRKTGNYRIGLILGNSGSSKVSFISVLPSLPAAPTINNPNVPKTPDISYKNTKTTFTWDENGNDISKLIVYQGNKTAQFLFRQHTESFDADYIDFRNFNEGNVYYRFQGTTTSNGITEPLKLSSGWSTGETETFTATTHTFSEINNEKISLNSTPEYFENIQKIDFSGTTFGDIYAEAAVIKPDGTVTTFNMKSSKPFSETGGADVISANRDYQFHYEPKVKGTYILEINGVDGEAVINTPVYMANGIPLIPDFFDLNKMEQKEETFDLSAMRNKLLDMINADRAKFGLSTVRSDTSLNNLAQSYSEDMVKRDFFGHINPEGETPDDRRIAAGIETPVGEDLAQSPTILYTHYGLMRSAIHRQSILTPSWTRIGIGIVKGDDDQLYVTEEFSTDPLTENDLNNLENDILDRINSMRTSTGLQQLESSATLNSIADDWSEKMVTQDFFDFTSPNGESLSSLVHAGEPSIVVQALILESNKADQLIDEVVSGEDVQSSQWDKLGVGLKVDNIGSIKATLLFTGN